MRGEGNIASPWKSTTTDAPTNGLVTTTAATTQGNLRESHSDTVRAAMGEDASIEPTELHHDVNKEGSPVEDDILPTDAWTKVAVKSKEEDFVGSSIKVKSISDTEDSGLSLVRGGDMMNVPTPKRSWSNNVTSPRLMKIGSSVQEAAGSLELDTTNGPKLIPKLLIMWSTLQPSVDTNFTVDSANTHESKQSAKEINDSSNVPRHAEIKSPATGEYTQEYFSLESSLSEKAARSNSSAAVVDIEEKSRLPDFINVTAPVSLPQMSGLSSGAGKNDYSTYTSHGSMCKFSNSTTCQNNGTCTTENGGFACTCTAFYRGRFCEESKLKLTVGEAIGKSATVHWSMEGVNGTVITSLYLSNGYRWDHVSTSRDHSSFSFDDLSPHQHYNQGVQSLFLCTHLSDSTQALYVSPEKSPWKTYSPDFLVRLTSVLNFSA
uniref:EGF-like domain-containing protein n=1 Tax=Branchiostoma floridae TaxID=7739 RepID=C3ZLR9_BRAFL|eukprot:XP_002590531.1 hypothetical protein BRAFLDRAFT_86203 [Branchiostoma floridae]